MLIGSVRNSNRLEDIFKTYHPDIVYHAAAHKHVPLMEDSPNEAIKNNVIGTYKTALRADKYHTKRFVLISTDKAVNPTNIMGASKRLCEMVIQMFAQKSQTIFTAVRFGNVLGSNGSVIPLFKKQIAHGGPVTVTHPDIIRYFMTIPEAVSLVLQAGAYARGGEIFVLDMGEPVKIADLARNLIRLSGLTPDVDIKIEYTGLRPGEKLYEELLMAEEGLKKTANQRIFIGNPLPVDADTLKRQLSMLEHEAWEECRNMKALVRQIVPEYRAAEVNTAAGSGGEVADALSGPPVGAADEATGALSGLSAGAAYEASEQNPGVAGVSAEAVASGAAGADAGESDPNSGVAGVSMEAVASGAAWADAEGSDPNPGAAGVSMGAVASGAVNAAAGQ